MCWICKANKAWRWIVTEVGSMHSCVECIEKREQRRELIMARYAERKVEATA